MKIGVNSLFIMKFEFDEALRLIQDLGAEAIEVAIMGEETRKFCDIDRLLANKDELKRWLDLLKLHGLQISALCAHGEPLSPNKEVAHAYSQRFRQVCQFGEAADVDRLVVVAGLPEGAPGDTSPCWVVDSFKPYSRSILRWQWEERLIPYWREHAKIAQDHGCLLCVEPQINDMVYSPKTVMRLREAIGPVVGCNLDPSHLFVQQIDVIEAIRFLSDAIYHVHIKDTRFDLRNVKLKGLLDPTSYLRPEERAWMFTLIGWGHDERFWRDFVTTLRFVGYEGALSVEMESEYIEVKEGIEKAFAFLKPLVLDKLPGTRWWEYGGLQSVMKD